MRIGLYGMPCAGKSYILDKIDFMERIEGSITMKRMFPDFVTADDDRKNQIRREFAEHLRIKDDFIMDGHYAFDKKIVFTESDGELYDVFLYLYVEPQILVSRMVISEKNMKYANKDIDKWQKREITELREYCHIHDKDFYVLDNTSLGYFESVDDIILFIMRITEGFSCVNYARKCTEYILQNELMQDTIKLLDGDKTISEKDTSNLIYGYITNIFDNNFYTGYQSWLHTRNFLEKYANQNISQIKKKTEEIKLNRFVVDRIDSHSYILTSGSENVWRIFANRFAVKYFCGEEMSADTKYFVAKFLKKAGKMIETYGDSMNDYFMNKEADIAYLIVKHDGTVSRSLTNVDIGGMNIVRIEENR